MKKFITFFLAFALLFTMCIPAFAAEVDAVITPRASNGISVSSANPSCQLQLNHTVYANQTRLTVHLNRDSDYKDDGIITIRLIGTELFY